MATPPRRQRHNPLDDSLDALDAAERASQAAVAPEAEPEPAVPEAIDTEQPEADTAEAASEAETPAATEAEPVTTPAKAAAPAGKGKRVTGSATPSAGPKRATKKPADSSEDPIAAMSERELLEAWARVDPRGQLQPGRRVTSARWSSQLDPDLSRRLNALAALSGEKVYSIVQRGLLVAIELGERELGIYVEPEPDDD